MDDLLLFLHEIVVFGQKITHVKIDLRYKYYLLQKHKQVIYILSKQKQFRFLTQ